jgi:uncharacterized protein (UPF0264 family)
MPWFPRLLVSVRNSAEAKIALDAGVDILDIKEPARGSLGNAEPATIHQIEQLARRHSPSVPVSVACGEVIDFPLSEPIPTAGVSFLKLGLAGLRGRRNWVSDWQDAKSQISTSGEADPASAWIAVAYVDDQAQAPPADEVLTAAIETKCRGLLFDTFGKNGQNLFDCIPQKKLRVLIAEAQQQGLLCALAGNLRLTDLERVRELHADIVAVRTAACVEQNRQAEISAEAIRNLRRSLADKGAWSEVS